jgi:hypothetical protein
METGGGIKGGEWNVDIAFGDAVDVMCGPEREKRRVDRLYLWLSR